MGRNDEHLHQFVIRGWRYGRHRDGALQFLDDPDTLSLTAFGLYEHERFAYVYDFTVYGYMTYVLSGERTACGRKRYRAVLRAADGARQNTPEVLSGL